MQRPRGRKGLEKQRKKYFWGPVNGSKLGAITELWLISLDAIMMGRPTGKAVYSSEMPAPVRRGDGVTVSAAFCQGTQQHIKPT